MTTKILNAIKAYAAECAICFVHEFPGEQLTDSDDWDSAAFEMRHDWDDVDDAFSVFRKHLVAEIARLNLERLQATLTEVTGASLKSSDLRKEARSAGNFRQCFRSSEKVGSDAIEIVFCPEINRAGVAAGSDAQWTDASSAAEDQEARLSRLAASLTQVPAQELRSQSLHMRMCEDPKCAQCVRSSMMLGTEAIEIVHCPVINRASVAAGGRAESMDASSPAEALSLYLRLWRIVTHPTVRGDVLPYGIRNEGGFICMFCAPTHYAGQNDRYKEECDELRKHADTMCAALNNA